MKRESLTTFKVESAVVHYVPTERDDPGDDLLLTDDEIALTDGLRDYFGGKIVERLEAKGLDVIRDDAQDACVPEAVTTLSGDPTELLAISRDIASHLDRVQTKSNSSGLLAIAYGRIGDDKPCLALLKMERERGVRFAINTVNGRHIVDLELLRNLTMTDKTKVYKTALLSTTASGEIEGYVADDQKRLTGGREVGQFFLSDFLGCKPRVPAAETTYKFVEAANKSFNSAVSDPERRGRYGVALLATLDSSAGEINPTLFAREHLDAADRPGFLETIKSAGIDPSAAFRKDPRLVKVSRFKMTFESGMVLVGSREDLDERVTIPTNQNASHPVELRDSISNLLSGR